MKKTGAKMPLIVSGALAAVLLGAMDLFLIPAIQKAAGGLRCFDMLLFDYRYETASAFLQALPEEGRTLYLYVQLPTDTAFIASYTVFFVLALRRLFASKAVFLLPSLLAAADFAENTCAFLMLRDPGILTPTSAAVFGGVTLCKTLLMYAVGLLLAVGLVKCFAQTRKKRGS